MGTRGVVCTWGVCVCPGAGVHTGGLRARGVVCTWGVCVCGVCVCARGRGCPRGLREVVAFPRYTPCPRGDTREIKYNKQYGSKYN